MDETAVDVRARVARSVAIGAAVVVTMLYALVGFEVVKVAGVAEVEPGPAVPLVFAAFLFGALTCALVLYPHRITYALGLVLNLLVIVGYFAVAPNRDPSFEAWGLTIKALELVLVVATAFLAVRPGSEPSTGQAGPKAAPSKAVPRV